MLTKCNLSLHLDLLRYLATLETLDLTLTSHSSCSSWASQAPVGMSHNVKPQLRDSYSMLIIEVEYAYFE